MGQELDEKFPTDPSGKGGRNAKAVAIGGRYLEVPEKLSFSLQLNVASFAYAMLAKGFPVTAARIFEKGSPPGSFLARNNNLLLDIGSARIQAARAAAIASIGGGRDAVRATEVDRAHFRSLAIGWLENELEYERQAFARSGSAIGRIQGMLAASPLKDSANMSVHMMLMHKDLDPVRNPLTIQLMPEPDRKRAETLWEGVRALHRVLNPPIELPRLAPGGEK